MDKPHRYLFSLSGLIDTSAVLFFFVPYVCSELLLWVFRFGRSYGCQEHRGDVRHCDACDPSLSSRA